MNEEAHRILKRAERLEAYVEGLKAKGITPTTALNVELAKAVRAASQVVIDQARAVALTESLLDYEPPVVPPKRPKRRHPRRRK